MPTKNFKSNNSLGKALMNKTGVSKAKKVDEDGFKIHTIDTGSTVVRPELKSILEQNSLEEFMQMAEMSKRKFEAEREGQHCIDTNTYIPDCE